MTPYTTRLGTEACRALMRALPGEPILLESCTPESLELAGETPAAERSEGGEWCVVLLPTPAEVSVRAQLQYSGLGTWKLAELTPSAGEFSTSIFVTYPDDPAEITGWEYKAMLRQAVRQALDAAKRSPGAKPEHPMAMSGRA